jgi:dienelactone hydrolase
MKTLITLLCAFSLTACAGVGHKVVTTEIHNGEKVNLYPQVHKASAKKAPTMILLHGCGGLNPVQMDEWARHFNQWGYNAVVMSLFPPRGAKQVCNRPASIVSPEQASVDIFETAKWVVKQEWATDKVGMIGFSYGGWTALHSVASNNVERNMGKQVLSAAIAYYPYCDLTFFYDKPVLPLQIHVGGADTWTAPGTCRDLAMKKNWNIEDNFFEYPGATHSFDVSTFNNKESLPDSNGLTYRLSYHKEAAALSRERIKAFLDKYLK